MARSSAWALLALVAVVQLACWRGTQRLEALGSQAEAHPLRRRELPQLLARWPGAPLDALDGLGNATLHARSLVEPLAKHEEQCFPLPILAPADELCAHVTAFCPPSGRLDYLRFYYCAGVRPAGNETAEAGKDALAGPLLAHGAETSSHRHADEPLPDGAERPPTHSRHGSTAPRHGKDGPPLPAGVALQRGLALATIVLWMLFLFSWVGVVASDFFCPNLSTLASRLGLNESTVSGSGRW
jgi:sodium/potassium/calcium exchanger 6